LAFSRSTHELVSTHGYSQNEINIWSYPRPKKVATLVGHSHRVLYLAMSPDGSTIVTGAGDETLRFWNVFPNRSESSGKKTSSYLNTDSIMLR
jgi:cell division cycle 20-like protein 1 (cofactor of APC complex)